MKDDPTVTVEIQGPPGSGKSLVFVSLLEWLTEQNTEGADITINPDESVIFNIVFNEQVPINVLLNVKQAEASSLVKPERKPEKRSGTTPRYTWCDNYVFLNPQLRKISSEDVVDD